MRDKCYLTAIDAPAVGAYLYASCAGDDYGRIVAVGEDANGVPTIDIEIKDPNELLYGIEDIAGTGEEHGLQRLEVPGDVKLILRYIQYKMRESHDPVKYPPSIICNTPGSGCFRCKNMFTMFTDSKEERYAR